jgi:hypothetical protein
MLSQLAQRGNLPHVLSDVQVGFAGNWATAGACSALYAFEKFMFLCQFLSIHLAHRF